MTLYRQPKEPFEPGKMRVKTWRMFEVNVAQDDPIWAARCKQYWELQERLFGVKMSDFTMLVDNNEGFVSTYSVCMDVLPGERTTDYERVPAQAAGVPSMRQ